MGDRSNIVVQDGDERVWLYGHWMGCASVEHAAVGLHSDRYDDPQHLAAVIYDHMRDAPRGEGRGFGISARQYDNQHKILVIDCRSRFTTGEDRGRADVWFEDGAGERISRVYSREEFLAIADEIPPWLSGYRGTREDHDCAFGHFPSLERGSDQIGAV